MRRKSKFGIIVLLDALGARNMSIESSQQYLDSVSHLRKEIHDALKITLNIDRKEKRGAEILFNRLRPRFFGDSLLMTYEIVRERQINSYLARIGFILNTLIPAALEKGILFRGALSIGKFIENEDVVLGPAVTDAATWYDKLEMIGIIATPATTNYIKGARNMTLKDITTRTPVGMEDEFLLYDVPIKGAGTLSTFVANWPMTIQDIHADIQNTDPLLWYYQRVMNQSVPSGAENKYKNTEQFMIAVVSQRNKVDYGKKQSSMP